jgi:protein SCO1/2
MKPGAAILAAAAFLAHPHAGAQALQLRAPPAVVFAPAPGARLPLDAVLRDQQGRKAPLGSWFGRVPVLLVPGYYRCSHLCGTVFEGVLQALALSGLRAGEVRLLGVSIDPREDAGAARARFDAYAALLPGGAADLSLLSGDAPALVRLQHSLGYRAVPDADDDQIAHAAGFVVVAPDGRIARFFSGVRFDPVELRSAVTAARAGLVQPSFGERLALLCAHLDLAAGRHNAAAIAAVRVAGLLVAFGLFAWMWRRLRGARP